MRQTTIINYDEQKKLKKWFIVDVKDKTLGRVSTVIASILRGKNKVTFTPNFDMGDNIIIINAKKIKLSFNKEKTKKYYSHSGYPGGLKVRTAAEIKKLKPRFLIEHSIKGMLPHTKLGRKQFKNLFVYEDEKHKHQAQKPEIIEVN